MTGFIVTAFVGLVTGLVVGLVYDLADWQYWVIMIPAAWLWTGIYHFNKVRDDSRR